MVAKLKTSFLKSSFQLFCHKTNLAPQNITQAIQQNDKNGQDTAAIKSNGIQFGSSPNLTLAPITNPPPDSSHSSDTNVANQHTKQQAFSSNRSASASGRVVEDEKLESSQSKKSDDKQNPDVNSKPVKKIPKILAKSKQLNNQASSTNGTVPKKHRSKSSNCLMDRDDYYNDINNNYGDSIKMIDDIDVEAKFFRHSFPNAQIESLDETQNRQIDDESHIYFNRQSSLNDVNNASTTNQQIKPKEEVRHSNF
jgi:hypothetical protein